MPVRHMISKLKLLYAAVELAADASLQNAMIANTCNACTDAFNAFWVFTTNR